MKRSVTACFGGTFDPPHLGHLHLAKAVIRHGLAGRVLFIPALTPPHKSEVMTPFADRLEMVKRMIAGLPGLSVSEIENNGNPQNPSYTILTLEALQALRPDEQMVLLIGADSLEQLHTWHRAADLTEWPMIVYPRPGFVLTFENLSTHWPLETAQKLLESLHPELEMTDISSTQIRKNWAEDPKKVAPFLSGPVLSFALDHNLYRTQSLSLRSRFLGWKLAGIIAIFWLWIGVLACYFSDYLIFQPHAPGYSDKMTGLIFIPVTDSERLAVYSIPTPGATQSVLYFHGNGEDISDVLNVMDAYHFLGIEPYTMDYRGYGQSSGNYSTSNFYKDAETVFRYLADGKKVPPSHIILHGRSLGGAAAISLASRYPVGGLIAESTFLSTFRVVTRYPILPVDKMRSYKAIPYVRCPTLFIHGKKDWVVPFSHGEELYRLANEPKFLYWAGGAGHNDLESYNPTEYWRVIWAFMEYCADSEG